MLPNYEVFHSLQSIIEINMFKNCKSLFDLISVFSLYRRHYFMILYCFCFYCYTCIIQSFILLFILYYFSHTRIPQHHDSKGKLVLEWQDFFFLDHFFYLPTSEILHQIKKHIYFIYDNM